MLPNNGPTAGASCYIRRKPVTLEAEFGSRIARSSAHTSANLSERSVWQGGTSLA